MLSSAFRPRTYRVIRRFSEDVDLTYDIRVIVLERDGGMIVGDRDQGIRDREIQRLWRAADLGRGLQGAVCPWRRAL